MLSEVGERDFILRRQGRTYLLCMEILAKLRKKRKRKILVLSAASPWSGLQCVYAQIEDLSWNVIHFESQPYPQALRESIQNLHSPADGSDTVGSLADTDLMMSRFAAESAVQFLQHVPKPVQKPDAVVFNGQKISSSTNGDNWCLTLGDAWLISQAVKTPVLTDLARHDIIAGGDGTPTTHAGDIRIASKAGDIAVFANLGIISQLTVVESWRPSVAISSNTGPGTHLINLAAQRAGCAEGFDRDGSSAALGEANTNCLESLANGEWFQLPGPKSAQAEDFEYLLENEQLKSLAPMDQLATITALTARTIVNFYKNNYKAEQKPEAIWISGGGTNNLALVEALDAYFSPTPVRNIEELGVPAVGKLPLALALSTNDFLDGKDIWPDDRKDRKAVPGRWAIAKSK